MFDSIVAWIEGSGSLIYALAPLFTVVVAILPIPAELPAVLNGMVFGPVWGSLVTWISALIGAQISFELARRFGRPLSQRLLPRRMLARADGMVESAGWPALLVLRLIPTVAFTAVNWASGLTTMARARFVWTTAVGILPGAVAFTTTGAGFLAILRGSGAAELAFYGLLAALALATLLLICSPRFRPHL